MKIDKKIYKLDNYYFNSYFSFYFYGYGYLVYKYNNYQQIFLRNLNSKLSLAL